MMICMCMLHIVESWWDNFYYSLVYSGYNPLWYLVSMAYSGYDFLHYRLTIYVCNAYGECGHVYDLPYLLCDLYKIIFKET